MSGWQAPLLDTQLPVTAKTDIDCPGGKTPGQPAVALPYYQHQPARQLALLVPSAVELPDKRRGERLVVAEPFIIIFKALGLLLTACEFTGRLGDPLGPRGPGTGASKRPGLMLDLSSILMFKYCPVLVTLPLPALVYSHQLSRSSRESFYSTQPDQVSNSETVEAEVAASCAALDDSDACQQRVPFPNEIHGAFIIRRAVDPNAMLTVAQNEADVNRYVEQYLYQPLEGASPLPGFMEHSFKMQCEKSDIFGQPDFVATAFNSAGQQQLLLAAESKTKMSFSVPDGSSTADAWQDPLLRKSIRGVEQVFGYMLQNGLHYSLLTTGELFVFMQRQGKSLQIADVHRTSTKTTPMAGIYHLMLRGASQPGRQVMSRDLYITASADAPLPTAPHTKSSATSWARQPLGLLLMHIASWWAILRLLQAFRRFRSTACSKEVWSLQELGVGAEIGCGRTGRVYEGRINGQRVAVKGHIIDSTFYFIATELMGPSLEFAVAGEEDLEPAAMRALERVHACGVLHGYTPWQEL
ncbi:hypothetical protein WJX74_003839 [Apatococcus lobatus]|uniref:Kinase n=1 Tax=Apatococcus lobatus TaxID=904363 RepID=A0AAW1QM92_9CHLO